MNVTRSRMLAAKTTCHDRWRQLIDTAGPIPVKHLLTLQEGVSEARRTATDREESRGQAAEPGLFTLA